MITHIVCRIGNQDEATFTAPSGEGVQYVGIDRSDETTVRNNALDICRIQKINPSVLAIDLVHLALAVHAADTMVYRSSGYDAWSRGIHLHLPVTDVSRWEAIRPVVLDMLNFLSGDHWEVTFRRASWVTPEPSPPPLLREVQPTAVSLFSGGMDSFIGAVDALRGGASLALVGHHGAGTTNKFQESVHAMLARHFPSRSVFLPYYSQSLLPEKRAAENTTRSRSLLFLALGTLTADSFGGLPLIIPENGLISLNPPLTNSRMGSLSTRTTHPHFLGCLESILRHLNIGVAFQTPYKFATKGEMARSVLSIQAFVDGVGQTMSCSHPDHGRYEGSSPGQHCGYCVPCIIRRAAMNAAGIDNPAHYLLDVCTQTPPATSAKARDPRAFHMAAARFSEKRSQELVIDVVSTGPVPPGDIAQYVDVYRRGMEEIRAFLRCS